MHRGAGQGASVKLENHAGRTFGFTANVAAAPSASEGYQRKQNIWSLVCSCFYIPWNPRTIKLTAANLQASRVYSVCIFFIGLGAQLLEKTQEEVFGLGIGDIGRAGKM